MQNVFYYIIRMLWMQYETQFLFRYFGIEELFVWWCKADWKACYVVFMQLCHLVISLFQRKVYNSLWCRVKEQASKYPPHLPSKHINCQRYNLHLIILIHNYTICYMPVMPYIRSIYRSKILLAFYWVHNWWAVVFSKSP